MSAIGYIQIHAFESYAQIPIKDAAIAVTDTDGNAIAMRLTNRNGALDSPIEITVPDLSASQYPDTGVIPFTCVNINARAEKYELIHIKDVQVFPNTVTLQNLEFIPLPELIDDPNASEQFQIPAQNL